MRSIHLTSIRFKVIDTIMHLLPTLISLSFITRTSNLIPKLPSFIFKYELEEKGTAKHFIMKTGIKKLSAGPGPPYMWISLVPREGLVPRPHPAHTRRRVSDRQVRAFLLA